jgi:hypothetical protein
MELDMADVKPSVTSWIIVTLMALTGIVLLKYVFNRWKIPGVTDVVNAA